MKPVFWLLFLGMFLFGCAGPTPIATALPTDIPTLVSPSNTIVPPTATLVPPTVTPTRPTVAGSPIPPSPASAKPAIDTPAWFNDVVLYEIFPRSFYDTNENGIGDLDGVTAKLDYLQDLGVGAIWLTPIFASPSYHGYDTTDYYTINPDFGTEQDLIDLVDEAHKRGIKVILDFVAGHTSDKHPFFQDAFGNPNSEYADWYRWLNDEHTSYQHFAAATDLPQLNQDNPATRDYLIDVAKYWIDKAKVDGYRLDYAINISHDFWKKFRTELKAINPDFLLLGEAWTSGLKIAPYYDNEFDATFDFPVYFDLMGSHDRAGNSPLLGRGSPASFQTSLRAQNRLYNPGAQSVRFLNNHDTLRVMSQLRDPERAKLAATLLLTLPSTPMLYYGEEIGMRGDKSDGDRTLREPMDWYAAESGTGMTAWYKPDSGFNKENDGISVQEEESKPDSLLTHYQTLIALRREHPALRQGEFVPIAIPNNNLVAAYARRTPEETIIVVLNTSDATADLTLNTGAFASGTVTPTDLLTDKTLSPAPAAAFPLSLAPRSGYVLLLN